MSILAGREQRGQRIILFLDEVSAASSEVLTWLRTQVLSVPISSQIVLVLGGPASLEQALPVEPTLPKWFRVGLAEGS